MVHLGIAELINSSLRDYMLQAYFDDSSRPNGFYVIAGHLACAETWIRFTRDWEELLPLALRDDKGVFHLKMNEMRETPERMERVLHFFKVIERYRHEMVSISCAIRISDVVRALERIWSFAYKLDLTQFDNYYALCFYFLMQAIHRSGAIISQNIDPREPTEFIFDQQSEKTFVLSVWGDYVRAQPEDIQCRIVSPPRFEDDKLVVPLQAADLWAWWMRRWHEEGEPDTLQYKGVAFDNIEIGDNARANSTIITVGEDQIAEWIIRQIRNAHKGAIVFDKRFTSRFVP